MLPRKGQGTGKALRVSTGPHVCVTLWDLRSSTQEAEGRWALHTAFPLTRSVDSWLDHDYIIYHDSPAVFDSLDM